MRLQRRRFSEATEVRKFPNGKVEIVELDDNAIGLMSYEPGWRWSKDVKPLVATDGCQNHHIAITLSGRLRFAMPDGTELEVGPGEVFGAPPGHDAWVVGDEPWVGADFQGMRTYAKPRYEDAVRQLASMVFTDIVESTRRAAELGPSSWSNLVAEHNRVAGRVIDGHRGRLVKKTGDGLLAQFDGAERAVRAAISIRQAVGALGLELRIGVHTGEVEVGPDDVRGIAVHTAARIMSDAAPSEILVSATVKDLVDGSGLVFEDAGLHELKGLAGQRQLFRLVTPA
jgi:class 3 adenylate cyclase